MQQTKIAWRGGDHRCIDSVMAGCSRGLPPPQVPTRRAALIGMNEHCVCVCDPGERSQEQIQGCVYLIYPRGAIR